MIARATKANRLGRACVCVCASACLFMWLGLAAGRARAHPVAFGVLVLRERTDGPGGPGGAVDVTFRFSGTESRLDGAEPRFDARCREVSPRRRTDVSNGVVLEVRLDCPGGLTGTTIAVEGREGEGIELAVHAELADGSVFDDRLDDERRTAVVRGGAASGIDRYVALGVEHIAFGVDHLLFVLGLLLLVGRLRPMLVTVTAFTVGHSVTLGLAVLGWIEVRARPVEACIALSVLVLALELARKDAGARGGAPGKHARAPTIAERWPWLLAGGFGLLHGLGFAGALREAGLPQASVGAALFGFNLGVELGQLGFIALCLAAYALLTRVTPQLSRARPLLITTLGSAAAFFLLDRLL